MDGVRRAAEVLDLFSVERPYWGPTDVAMAVGVAKSSAHALLSELARAGLVERMACGKYRLGWRVVGLARTMLESNDYRNTVIPVVNGLARRLGETVHLAALDGENVLYVASAVPTGGVSAPAVAVAAERTPMGQVLNDEHEGVIVGPQQVLKDVACAATALKLRGETTASVGVCAPTERFTKHRDLYTRAVEGTRRRLAHNVRQ